MESLKTAHAFGVRIAAGNNTHIVLFRQRDAKGAMNGGALESDGDVAAVHYDSQSGTVQSAFAGRATRLRFRGKELFRNATPTDWSLPTERK